MVKTLILKLLALCGLSFLVFGCGKPNFLKDHNSAGVYKSEDKRYFVNTPYSTDPLTNEQVKIEREKKGPVYYARFEYPQLEQIFRLMHVKQRDMYDEELNVDQRANTYYNETLAEAHKEAIDKQRHLKFPVIKDATINLVDEQRIGNYYFRLYKETVSTPHQEGWQQFHAIYYVENEKHREGFWITVPITEVNEDFFKRTLSEHRMPPVNNFIYSFRVRRA